MAEASDVEALLADLLTSDEEELVDRRTLVAVDAPNVEPGKSADAVQDQVASAPLTVTGAWDESLSEGTDTGSDGVASSEPQACVPDPVEKPSGHTSAEHWSSPVPTMQLPEPDICHQAGTIDDDGLSDITTDSLELSEYQQEQQLLSDEVGAGSGLGERQEVVLCEQPEAAEPVLGATTEQESTQQQQHSAGLLDFESQMSSQLPTNTRKGGLEELPGEQAHEGDAWGHHGGIPAQQVPAGASSGGTQPGQSAYHAQQGQRAEPAQHDEEAEDIEQGHQAQQQQQQSMLDLAVAIEMRLATDSEEVGVELSGEGSSHHQDVLLASLISQLEVGAADQQTPTPEGFTDDRGAAVGRLAAARAFLSPAFEPLFKGLQQHGMPSVLTKYRSMVAVGTSGGSVYALMPAGKKDPQGQPRLVEVGASERGSAPSAASPDGVTALCMAQHGTSAIVMVSGHASGALKFWELKSHITGGMTWSLSKTLANVHASAVTSCAVLEGGPTTWALSGDAHGRLMCHNVSRHLSVAAQALTSFTRQLTGGGGIPSHLISLQAAGQDPGVVMGISPLHAVAAQSTSPAGRAGEGGAANADQAAFVFIPDVGHFVLLCAARAVLLCLLSQEGRMRVLHVFLPPPNTPADHPPYAAWRLEQDQQGAALGAVVAVAWQYSISVYRTVLLWRRPVSQGRRQSQGHHQEATEQLPLPPPALLNSWVLRSLVGGTCFLDSGTLLVACSRGETATEVLLYLPEQYSNTVHKLSQQQQHQQHLGQQAQQGRLEGGGQASGQRDDGSVESAVQGSVEGMVVQDWVVGSQVSPLGGSGLHSGVASFGEQTLMLTSQGVRVVQLLGWQQRLSVLIAQRKMTHALLAAVRIFHVAGQPPGAVRWPADGAGANPADVSRQILLVLCGMLDTELPRLGVGEGGQPDAVQQSPSSAVQPAWLAEVCINTCLFLGRPDALLSEVFPRWSPTPLLSHFLKQLEPHILRNQLPSLAPEVMQALVELFVREGQPERVERCVLRMDIMSLDLNQLIPLCLRHHLYGALLHIFTGAMQDYQTPASLLMVAAAAELDREAQHAQQPCGGEMTGPTLLAQREGLRPGYKLLVFLRCCLTGEGYPPGSGAVSAEQQHAVKLQAVAFLLYASCLSVWECWRLWGEMAHAETADSVKELPLAVADPHPALRLLCRMDAAATLGLLRGALAGWDAMEADLAEVVPSVAQQLPAAAVGGDRTITQVVVNSVVELLQTNALKGAPSSAGASNIPAATSGACQAAEDGLTSQPASAETTALQFVADHLASNRAVVPPSIVMRILGHLAAPAPAHAQQQAQHAQRERQREREATFRDVVTHAAKALGEMDRQEALWLARRAEFHQAEARMRELEGAHGEALACLTRGTRHPGAPFRFVRGLLSDPATLPATRDALEQAVLQQAAPLMQLDATSAAQLVLDCFPHQQQEVLRRLDATPRLQLDFLRQLVALQRRGGAGGAEDVLDESLKASSQDPRLRPLLGDMAVANLFVELLCRFDPGAVLPFLQGHDTYGVDECLRQCLDHAVQDGAAFLLERRGDVQTAVGIYIRSLEAANQALVAAVKGGGEVVDGWAEAVLPGGHAPKSRAPHRRSLSWGGRQGPGALGALGGLSPAGRRHGPRGGSLPELQAAQEALRNAVAVCVRFSQDRQGQAGDASGMSHPAGGGVQEGRGGEGGGTPPLPAADPVQHIWFRVLSGYVMKIRELRQEEQRLVTEEKGGSSSAAASGSTAAPESGTAGLAASCQLDPAQHRQLQRVMLLQKIFTGFMEEVIGGMSGQVPMRDIAESMMQQYSKDQWGDFKSTLLGLLSACNYELSILRCAHRVVGSDGARLLKAGYRQCSRPEQGG